MCTLFGWPKAYTLEDASAQIRTTGLNEPAFVLWNMSWHGFRTLLPIRVAAQVQPEAFRGFADFQNRPFPMQRVGTGRDAGLWLVACRVAPFSYQTIQPSSRKWEGSSPAVEMLPDAWTSREWSLRWESITGGVRQLELFGAPIVTDARGLALTPSLPGRETGRPGLPVKRLVWVEEGPLRWACEMDMGDSQPESVRARLEYTVDPMTVRFFLYGAGFPRGEYTVPLPEAAGGAIPILGERGPAGSDWFFAWQNLDQTGLVTLHMAALGALTACSEPAQGGDGQGLPSSLTWSWGGDDVSSGVADGAERIVFQWTLRGCRMDGLGGVKVALDGLLQEQGHWLQLVPVREQVGSRVAAGSGLMLRGPAEIAGEAVEGGQYGEWLLPIQPLYAGLSPGQPWEFSIWLEESPREVQMSPAPPGKGDGAVEWTGLGPARNSFDVHLPAVPEEPVWIRIRW